MRNFRLSLLLNEKSTNITLTLSKYELSLIGNADQTPLTFDMPSNSTVDSKGTKSVSIMTTGHEKDRFTVMLACLGDGTKLPPYVVFKRKTLPKDLVLPRGIHVRAQAKGWMDESLVEDWLNIHGIYKYFPLPN